MKGYAPETRVVKTCFGPRTCGSSGELEAIRNSGAGARGFVYLNGSSRVAVLNKDPVLKVGTAHRLKGTIADEFSIKPTIVGIIDLFGHDSVEGWAYPCDGCGRIDRKGGSALGDSA